ncbi:MAG: sulfite exporter TauE/SafE family protein, partial [Gammaproteobacteria bacterium]
VSVLIIAPLGFTTGLLAAFIAVGGFIGVPAMMFVLGVPAIMATATELVVAFVMGLGGSMLYSWEGFVDIRLSMLILAGSLFGVQVGVVATTYVNENFVKKVMASIMIIVLVSRLLVIPDYLSSLKMINPLEGNWSILLHQLSDITLALALFIGATSIISASIFGAIGILRKQKLMENQT